MDLQYYLKDSGPFKDFFREHDYAVMHAIQPNNGKHRHPEYFELGYMISGTAVHTLNGETTLIKKGDYFIMDQTSVHAYFGDENCQVVNLLFHPRLIDAGLASCTMLSELVSHFLISFLPQNISRVHWQIFHDNDGKILRLIDAIAEEQFETQPGNRAMIRSYMIQLLVTIMRQVGQEERHRYSTLINDVLTVIEQKYATSLTLRHIAERLNYSPAYLSRLFTKEVGQSFSEYLQHCRLERASSRLANSTEPVCKIAESVGYKDVEFFYQLFKKRYGCTPTAYRKKFNA